MEKIKKNVDEPGPEIQEKGDNFESVQEGRSKNYLAPSPLSELIPGIDLSKLNSDETKNRWREQADSDKRANPWDIYEGTAEVGRDQGDTHFFAHFFADFVNEKDVSFYLKNKISPVEAGSSASDRYKMIEVGSLNLKLELLKEKFSGRTLVEIGQGSDTFFLPYGYMFAELVGARAYVAVDPFADIALNFGRSVESMAAHSVETNIPISKEIISNKNLDKNLIPWASVNDDGLAFLEALPDKSICVLMGGIQDDVIPSKRLVKMEKEIERVLADGGGFMMVECEPLDKSVNLDMDMRILTKNAKGKIFVRKEK